MVTWGDVFPGYWIFGAPVVSAAQFISRRSHKRMAATLQGPTLSLSMKGGWKTRLTLSASFSLSFSLSCSRALSLSLSL